MRTWGARGTVMLAAVLLLGCGEGARVMLGPPPAKYVRAEPVQRRTVDELRAWLAGLPAEQAQELDTEKQLSLGSRDVQTTQPRRAKVLAEYVAWLQASVEKQAAEKGLEAPRLSLQSITFQDLGQRSYQCMFDLGEGNRSSLLLAETQ